MALLDALQAAGVTSRAGDAKAPFDQATPAVVALPTSTEQVAETMRLAHEAGATVAVRAGGTKLSWGGPTDSIDVVVDLSGMNAVLEHQPGDLIASAQAGCRLADLQQPCATAGQRLAVDEMVPGTTIGGLIATNPSGPLRLLAGTVRDVLIGITIVLADGTIARAGGKVVKNVAGYDLGKLMVGSYGTLAVVTEATFRLHPVPAAAQWVSTTVSLADLDPVLAAVLHTQDAPSAIELRCAAGDSVEVTVLLEGTEEGVAARARRVADLIDGQLHVPAPWTGGYPWVVGSGTGLKITCQLSAVADVVRTAADLGWTVQGSAGAGVLYATTVDPSATEVSTALDRLRSVATGGSVTVLDAPAAIRREVDVWGPVPALDLMQSVKNRFDPDHALSPGRFVGGI